MKRLVLIALCSVIICFTVSAQKEAEEKGDVKAPAALKAAFAKQFPKATDVKWGKEGADYEVGMKNNGQEMTVVMNSKGVVTETEVGIKVTELPSAVTKYVAEKFKGKKILTADKITAGTKITFEVVVQKGKAMMFDANGKYLNTGKD